MLHVLDTYYSIRKFRQQKMIEVATDHYALNQLHDQLMQQVVHVAQQEVSKKWGISPTSFAFFVMGSAGRFEQAMWSDQDHGIIYKEDSKHAKEYFQELGQEITEGLRIAGYSLCDGKVMSSNPLWCTTVAGWKKQLSHWMEDQSFDSIRHLLIFFDGRVLMGHSVYLDELKELLFTQIERSPHLLQRMLENTMHIKKGLGIFGQFLVEPYGRHSGSIHLKESAFFPYVNALRLLALKERMREPSTLGRFDQLLSIRKYGKELPSYKKSFLTLLEYRLLMLENQRDYDSVHYLNIESLNKNQKREIKEILRNGIKLYNYTKKVIEKGC